MDPETREHVEKVIMEILGSKLDAVREAVKNP